ncbi:MAG: sulfotransferase [Chloroflexi bacterium]|nr:sulfotransferase [Chloroflexota bacterium]
MTMWPTSVTRAICDTERSTFPFQYYTTPGEAIYQLEFRSHVFNGLGYLHFDAQQRLAAQVMTHDQPAFPEELERWAVLSPEELDAFNAQPADFEDLLLKMHLAASSQPDLVYQPVELAQLRGLFPKPPILIGGCGRSGTTLLLSILGAHPHIHAIHEEMFAFFPRPFRLRPLLRHLHGLDPGAGWQRWCEKTPKNVRAFGDILAAFEGQARLIHMVRDGRDVVTSHHPNSSQRYYVPPERWVADVQAGLTYADQSLLIRYEDLIADLEGTLRQVCDYVEEEFDPRLLDFARHTTVTENKAWEGRKVRSLHNERIGRWQQPGHQRVIQEFISTPQAAELMARLGYAIREMP